MRVHPMRLDRLIIVAFVLLATIYSLATPVFEASDEYLHFPVVKHIADGYGLPVQRPGTKTAWEQEGSQPPLYYLLVSPIARWIDTRDMPERLRYNPHAQPGDPYRTANKNLIVHSSAESFPWQGTALAVHLIRFVSIAMGAATVAAAGALVREIAPERPDLATGAMALTAFTPMFLFISASVNNDNLVILLSTIGLALTAQILNERRSGRREAEAFPAKPATRPRPLSAGVAGCVRGSPTPEGGSGEQSRSAGSRRWLIRRVALALVAGLAALSKVSGLGLLAPAAVALSVVHLPKREWGRWVGSGLLLIAGVAAIAGWWYVRNTGLYGEWLGMETMADVAGRRAMTLPQLLPEFEGFKIAYWALFGAVNILTLPLAYVFYDVVTALAIPGILLTIRRARRGEDQRGPWPWLVLALYVLTVFVGVVRWTSITPASQGRLLFPAIGAISALLWLGWDTLTQGIAALAQADKVGASAKRALALRLASRGLKWGVPAVMFLIALRAPFADIAPTYAAVPYIDDSELPADMQALNVTFDDRMRLLGVTSPRSVDSSGQLSATLYWQCLVAMAENYSVSLSAAGRERAEIGKVDAYPHRGGLATSDCPAGAIFADEYRVPLDPNARRPTLVRVQVNLIDWSRQHWAALVDGAGNPIPALTFDASALPGLGDAPDKGNRGPAVLSRYTFGNAIRLEGYTWRAASTAPRQIELDLRWFALQRPSQDYTVFIHLLDGQGRMVAQWDSQPLYGDYPTSWWQPGETVLDARALPLPGDLPAGAYRLALGLYQAPDGARLPVRDDHQNPVPDDRVLIHVTLP